MKRVLLVTAIALTLSACGSVNLNKAENPGAMTPIQSQKLTSNFTRKGIKLEFDCGTVSSWTSGCNKAEPTAIEVTAYAPSYGNSENNREQAFRVAEMRAKAKLRHFIQEDVSSSQVKTVIAKNIEKANDRIKQRISANEEVNMTDDEATKETNWAIRENTNDTVQTLTETVRVNAQGILRGVRSIDEKIVDRQTVQVTIRWDRNGERASQFFRNQWRVQQ
jgi:hypothetical protein